MQSVGWDVILSTRCAYPSPGDGSRYAECGLGCDPQHQVCITNKAKAVVSCYLLGDSDNVSSIRAGNSVIFYCKYSVSLERHVCAHSIIAFYCEDV